MTDGDISDIEKMVEVTELIGLAETERRIYETLESNNQLTGGLLDAYHHHEQGIQLLIKYQKELASA